MALAVLEILPAELLSFIINDVTTLSDLAALASTCTTLHSRVSPTLYERAAAFHPGLLPWACGRPDQVPLVRMLLHTGGDPTTQLLKHFEESRPLRWDPERTAIEVFGTKEDKFVCAADVQSPQFLPTPTKTLVAISTYADLHHSVHRRDIRHAWRYWVMTWSSIHVAATTGSLDALRMLLEHPKREHLLSSLAAGYGQTQVQINRAALGRRCKRGETVAELRYRDGPQIYRNGGSVPKDCWRLFTALEAAIHARQFDAAHLLIDAGACLNFGPGPRGQSEHALHTAARYGCTETIRYLASIPGIDINLLDSDGWTPLCYAILSLDEEAGDAAVRCLLDLRADIHASLPPARREADGFTHLHLACWNKQWRRAMLLVAAGADVNRLYTPPLANKATHTESLIDLDDENQDEPEVDAQDWYFYQHHHPQYAPDSVRAIDLVCLEPCVAFRKESRDDNAKMDNIEDRATFLRTLVRGLHGADEARKLPLCEAALHPYCPVALLSAFHDAGVDFRKEKGLLHSLFFYPRWNRQDHAPVVLRWLLDHGAQLSSVADHGTPRDAIVRTICWDLKKDNVDRATEILCLLLRDGVADLAPLREQSHSMVSWIEGNYGYNRSQEPQGLLQDFLAERRSCMPAQESTVMGMAGPIEKRFDNREKMRKVIQALVDCGISMPRMVDVLHDFILWIPPLHHWGRFVSKFSWGLDDYPDDHIEGHSEADFVVDPARTLYSGNGSHLRKMLNFCREYLISIIYIVNGYLQAPSVDELHNRLFPDTANHGTKSEVLDNGILRNEKGEIEACHLMIELLNYPVDEHYTQEYRRNVDRFIYLARTCRARLYCIRPETSGGEDMD